MNWILLEMVNGIFVSRPNIGIDVLLWRRQGMFQIGHLSNCGRWYVNASEYNNAELVQRYSHFMIVEKPC